MKTREKGERQISMDVARYKNLSERGREAKDHRCVGSGVVGGFGIR